MGVNPGAWPASPSPGNKAALRKIKIRRPTADKAKRYVEVLADNPGVYPSMAAIRPGAPLVIVEGEFGAMLLRQALAGLAGVITTGSSSSGLDPAMLPAMIRCPRWYAAHDSDSRGDEAAEKCFARAVRVRPPTG